MQNLNQIGLTLSEIINLTMLTDGRAEGCRGKPITMTSVGRISRLQVTLLTRHSRI